MKECIAASGIWGSVLWVAGESGDFPAKEYYDELPDVDKAKVLALFNLFAERGSISNREKFKKLEEGLFEFKSFQLRFLGNFDGRGRFIVVHALRKKQDKLSPSDVKVARERLKTFNRE